LTELRVVLCDLDDTLFDHHGTTRIALDVVRGVDASLGSWTLDELDARHRVLLEALHVEVLAGTLSIEEARLTRFSQLLADAECSDVSSRAPAVARCYREAYERAWRAVPGAIDVLRLLKAAGLPVIVVTNNNVAEQQLKIARVGLQEYIDGLITSEETGSCKPDRAIFACALERAGVQPAEAVMFGDAWATDIEGALGAGIRPVWLNRFGQTSRNPAVAEVTSLVPAAATVEVLRRGV